MGNSCSKRGFTLNLAMYTVLRHENSIQSCIFSVCIPSPIAPVTMKTHLLQDKFMEVSVIHWENMIYAYIYIDSSSLVNVSP